MSNVKNPSDAVRTDDDLPTTTIFDLLANEQRQLALLYLTQKVGAVHISDLADQIALWKGEHTRNQYERIATSLVHNHIPKLVEAGVVEYDEDELVMLLDTASAIRPYLDLAAPIENL